MNLGQFFSAPRAPRRISRGTRASRSRCAPVVDRLESRTVLSTLSSITGNLNGTAIPANDTVWFSSVAKVQGTGSSPVTVEINNQTISFTANGTLTTVSVPNTLLVLSPTAKTATTTYDAAANTWDTTAPMSFSGNVFLAGVALPTGGGLPGGIKNVTWQGQFSTDTTGIKVNWQWAAAVYTQFSTDPSAVGVKPVDDNHVSQYQNSDHAGTPENDTPYVIGGATGGGGSNFTGSYSATATVTPSVGLPATTGSLSGYVTLNGGPDAGVTVVLTGVDNQGDAVSLTTVTDGNGMYSFTGLQAGIYTVDEPQVRSISSTSSVGTDNGLSDGTIDQYGNITSIVLAAGDQGVQYNFAFTYVIG